MIALPTSLTDFSFTKGAVLNKSNPLNLMSIDSHE